MCGSLLLSILEVYLIHKSCKSFRQKQGKKYWRLTPVTPRWWRQSGAIVVFCVIQSNSLTTMMNIWIMHNDRILEKSRKLQFPFIYPFWSKFNRKCWTFTQWNAIIVVLIKHNWIINKTSECSVAWLLEMGMHWPPYLYENFFCNLQHKHFIKATTKSITDGRLWGSFWYNETETAGQRLKWLYSWIVNTRPAWRFMFKFHGYEHLNCTIVRLPQHRRGPGDEGILFLCELLKYILKLVLPLALSPILIHTNWALSIVTIPQNRWV